MINENPERITELLATHISNIKASVLAVHPNYEAMFKTGTEYDGSGKVKGYLSFFPQSDVAKECIDLTLMLSNTQRGAVFAAELAWSGGKTIDEIAVCEVCPDCLDDLCGCIDNLVNRIREPLVEQMVVLLNNFESRID